MEEEKKEKECARCEEYLNGWKRAAADLANYKKDEARRFEDFAKLANAALILNLLPVLDSFYKTSGEPQIREQLEAVLKKAGLEKIEVKVGDAFNPALHESVGEVDGSPSTGSTSSPQASSGQQFPQIVAEIVETGYNLHGKLLRPAKVKVVKG